jgi:hypothetical protein
MSFFVPGVISTSPLITYPLGYLNPIVTSPYSEISVSVTADSLPTRTETFKVQSLPVFNYYAPNTLMYVGDPVYYSYPVYKNVSYLDVNADKDLQKKVVRYFYAQLYNKWVPELHHKLLDYVKISNKDITLVKSLNEAKNNNTKDDDYYEKINYLADYVFTKTDIHKELSEYANKRGLNWWNLRNNSDELELMLVKKLEEKLKDMVME